MKEKEVIRIIRLVDLYKLNFLQLKIKNLLGLDKNGIEIQLKVAKEFIQDEIEKRQNKFQKQAKKFLKENPKKIYLKYYQNKYE